MRISSNALHGKFVVSPAQHDWFVDLFYFAINLVPNLAKFSDCLPLGFLVHRKAGASVFEARFVNCYLR